MLRLGKYSIGLLATTMFYVAPAYGQATRTWVSGVGDDVNPCSRTAPCKTFAGAISKTAAGGEIDCLDPGGFGAVTITKSITIDCDGTFGSILASNVNGINVNDSASGFPNTAQVIIRGLSINGAGGGAQNAQGNPGTGVIGINFTSGASLTLEEVIIQRFNTSTATGIRFAPGGSAQLEVNNSVITNNGTGGSGGGIVIQPTGTGTARASLSNVVVNGSGNTGVALTVNTSGNTGAGITVSVEHSVFTGSSTGMSLSAPAGTTVAVVTVHDSAITNNTTGVLGNGVNLTGQFADSTISGNGTGLTAVSGANLLSWGNNRLNGNPTNGAANNGAFTGTVVFH